jgi:hypothetical protein
MMQTPRDEPWLPHAARLSRRAALGGIGGLAAAVVGLSGSPAAGDPDKVKKDKDKHGPFDLGSSVGPLARYGSTATLLPTGLVLVVGGFQSSVLSSTQVYDPDSDRWFDVAPMNTPRYNHAAVSLDGRLVLVLGGQATAVLSSVEVYDPWADAWTLADPLSRPRFGHSAVQLHKGGVLVSGGFHHAPLSSVEIYDVHTLV